MFMPLKRETDLFYSEPLIVTSFPILPLILTSLPTSLYHSRVETEIGYCPRFAVCPSFAVCPTPRQKNTLITALTTTPPEIFSAYSPEKNETQPQCSHTFQRACPVSSSRNHKCTGKHIKIPISKSPNKKYANNTTTKTQMTWWEQSF